MKTVNSYTLAATPATATQFGPSNTPMVDAAPVYVDVTATTDGTLRIVNSYNRITPSALKESSIRVRSALASCGIPFTGATVTLRGGSETIDVSLLDLPIAVGYLAETNPYIAQDLELMLVAGELGLDGSVRGVRGVVAACVMASGWLLRVLVPADNTSEALAVDGFDVHSIGDLRCLASELQVSLPRAVTRIGKADRRLVCDFSDVRGMESTVASVVDAVGIGRDIALAGSPGVGKTMIARRIHTILPPLDREGRIEVMKVYSSLGMGSAFFNERPFRAPHHTISASALVGTPRGLGKVRAGEVHLASRGVLFLDEVTEFRRDALESLGHALRGMSKKVRPLVVIASNPCPCGWSGCAVRECTCTQAMKERHEKRYDDAIRYLGLREATEIAVSAVGLDTVRSAVPAESSESIRTRLWGEFK